MRIIQLIDSLEAGGAERMAVNYANSLSEKIAFSGLVTTREEGVLKKQIEENVSYLFLKKKKALDLKALFKLRQFVKTNNVGIVHAHGTSFFIAVLLKLVTPHIRIVWHDHYGNSEFLDRRPASVLSFCSLFFEGIITVNSKLEVWARKNLRCKKVLFLSNFVSFENESKEKTQLKGIDGKRIVCLANLREQKNHLLLLEVAKKIKFDFPEWTFHLIGKDFEDRYSERVKEIIEKDSLSELVFLYGTREDVENILCQCEIAILTSSSEGLPVALLEYGYYGKAVVATNVGQIASVVKDKENGLLVESNDVVQFYSQLALLIDNSSLKIQLGKKLKETILSDYTEKAVIDTYLEFLT